MKKKYAEKQEHRDGKSQRMDGKGAIDGRAEVGVEGVHGNDATKVFSRRMPDVTLTPTTDCEVMYLGERWNWNNYTTEKAIWDTGADTTAITKEVADKLGIVISCWRNVGSIGGNSVAGRARVNIRLGDIVLPFWEVNVFDMTEREKEAERLKVPYDHPDVWIGMDIICQGKLTLDSTGSATVLTFEI